MFSVRHKIQNRAVVAEVTAKSGLVATRVMDVYTLAMSL